LFWEITKNFPKHFQYATLQDSSTTNNKKMLNIQKPKCHYTRHSNEWVKQNKESPGKAKGNAQQQCMFESPVFYSHQRLPDNQWLIIYSVLLVLTRGCNMSHSANSLSVENRKFSPPLHI